MAILRATLAAFDSVNFQADAWIDGAATRATTGMSVSRGLPADEMVAGRRILIETGGQADQALFMVIAVFA